VFERAQRRFREIVGAEDASWPEAHMSLGGFGIPDRPIDHAIERELVSLVGPVFVDEVELLGLRRRPRTTPGRFPLLGRP